MKKILTSALLFGAIQPALGSTDSTSQPEIERAWLAFDSARGAASLIRGDLQHPSANEVFRVIPEVGASSLLEDKLRLGSDLFNEARLSRDGTVACSSCHIGMMGGADRRPIPFGIGGAAGTLNVPTVFNAALNFRQFWDGRALTLQEQALGPIENPAEFGHDLEGAVAVLESIPDYVSAFDRVYVDGISGANLTDAIAYYETMNFTGLSSPFLRQFEEGQPSLSEQAQSGQRRFVEVGCASCHNGINLGGNSYQQLGVIEPWYEDDRVAREADDGLFGRTGREQDRHVFKVPTLHNVAITGPWLHDGSIVSLQQTVDRMARHQAGRYLENEDIDDIVAFLRSLGDSLGMVGDCAVSGSYSVTLDCNINQSTLTEVSDHPQKAASLPAPEILAQRHQQEYDAAMDQAADGPARIEEEMRRIRSGEVAHYDFLQYEHIEMLRHARALSHPPATLVDGERDALLKQAEKLQQSAEQYELIIADFLRAYAIASGALTNYRDLLRILSTDADEKTLAQLAAAERSLLAFYEAPNGATQRELEGTTNSLYGVDLNHERVKELETQVRMLMGSVPEIRG